MPSRPQRTPGMIPGALALCFLLLLGCGGGVKPSADVARTALERSLSSWRDGTPADQLAAADPSVQFNDSVRKRGRKLASFEILGAEGTEGDQRFRTKLTYTDPAGSEETRYVVLGRGPIWVHREEDYQRMLNMDDNPSDPKSKTGRR